MHGAKHILDPLVSAESAIHSLILTWSVLQLFAGKRVEMLQAAALLTLQGVLKVQHPHRKLENPSTSCTELVDSDLAAAASSDRL